MTDDIVTRLRSTSFCPEWSDHALSYGLHADGSAVSVFEAAGMLCDAAADEIERLRNLVDDLLPFAINDVEQGLQVAEEGHSDQCDDCMWYESSLEWKKRIDAWQEARRD